jgi:hypothetical protein
VVEDDAESIRPEIIRAKVQLAQLQIDNWLIFLGLLRAKFETIQ